MKTAPCNVYILYGAILARIFSFGIDHFVATTSLHARVFGPFDRLAFSVELARFPTRKPKRALGCIVQYEQDTIRIQLRPHTAIRGYPVSEAMLDKG